MKFVFTCPHCFHKSQVDRGLVGKSGPCAECGRTVTIQPTIAGTTATYPVGQRCAANQSNPEPARSDLRPKQSRVARYLTRIALAIVAFALIAFVIGTVFKLAQPSVTAIRARSHAILCSNNLILIGQALISYAAEHGTYPPAVVYGDSQQKLHSWRTLILQELGEIKLAKQIDLHNAWSDQENVSLENSHMPKAYRCPVLGSASNCNYAIVAGPGTIWQQNQPLAPSDISDGLENTILVVESPRLTTAWYEPVDLTPAELLTQIKTAWGTHEGGVNFVFADGSPGFLPDTVSPADVVALLSPNGGETIDTAKYKRPILR